MRCGALFLILWLSNHDVSAQILRALPGDISSGGTTTIWDDSHNAFGRALKNLQANHWGPFRLGKKIFIAQWQVEDPGGLEGLGPLYNATSCDSCHFKDGRGRLPGDASENLVATLSPLRGQGQFEHAKYGLQLQDKAVPGARHEGQLVVSWIEEFGTYGDGESYRLRRPQLQLAQLRLGALEPGRLINLRMPPQIFGLGLLEALPTSTLLKKEDPDDRDGDGISGRAQWVQDPVSGARVLGRFGWKASKAHLDHQVAAALSQDIGVSSALIPIEPGESGDRPGKLEMADYRLQRLLHYVRALAVPGRRFWDRLDVVEGARLFHGIGCAACHQPRQRTGSETRLPELANQEIYPYSDLLLHDMGESLADGFAEGEATNREWRTPPLWGLGYLETVQGETKLLHDGRARSFEEAILWHDGEAKTARDNFKRLSKHQRAQLTAFLKSL